MTTTETPKVEERPLDALLAAYAARTLSEPLNALVAAHLELKADNRAYVAALEAAHGVFLEELEPVPLVGRDRRLVNIFSSQNPVASDRAAAAPADPGDAVLPLALRRLIGCDYGHVPWRAKLPGIKEAVVAQDDACVVSFVCAQPGRQLPLRTDDDLKVALVLAGTLVDHARRYQRGDIVFADRGTEIRPLVDGDSECVCLVVSTGRARASGRLARMWQRVIG